MNVAIKPVGFCDLNINGNTENLKRVVLKALALGFQTIAINTAYNPNELAALQQIEGSKKLKGKKTVTPCIPEPITVAMQEQELQRWGIHQQFVILTRLNVFYSNIHDNIIYKYKNEMEKYDLISFTPLSEDALRQIITTIPIVDIISIDLSWCLTKMPRKLLKMAVDKDIYFEIKYSPCIGFHNSSIRKETFQLAQRLFQYIKCKNVFISSGANSSDTLRSPHDVMNLARFLSLSFGLSRNCISRICHDVIHCAMQRRFGVNKCCPRIEVVPETKIDPVDKTAIEKKCMKRKLNQAIIDESANFSSEN